MTGHVAPSAVSIAGELSHFLWAGYVDAADRPMRDRRRPGTRFSLQSSRCHCTGR